MDEARMIRPDVCEVGGSGGMAWAGWGVMVRIHSVSKRWPLALGGNPAQPPTGMQTPGGRVSVADEEQRRKVLMLIQTG